MNQQQLYELFQQVNRQIRREIFQNESEKQKNFLSPGQERLLRVLNRHSGKSQKELAEMIRVRPSSLSEVLKKLEEKSLLIKKQDENDRRFNAYFLTSEGKELAEQLILQRKNKGAEFFDILTLEEQENLGKILEKLSQNKKS